MSEERESTISASSNHHNSLRFLELSLRLVATPLCAASLWLTVVNKQTSDSYGNVAFNNLSGLRDWILLIVDQLVAYLMVTSGSAAAEVLYLAREGDRKASWSEACSYFGRFCDRIKGSLALHLAALLSFIALALVSAYRVFSKFEAPSVSTTKEAAEVDQ
ncbi:CASP-like protein 2D1 isoform X2 [Zingiber officinale]|uniref:CASP-like protein 2D1 isoform X2 n=1 Tax=Zingiber officinale TaxID=94328 RepID=UPI001C4B6A8A|nr:CASP-like protein 2D1 isoform X2 [Zingiber officinale]